ncbi:MAG: hypothetical protein CALGDGBN_03036 [Pseudomonadales bacterium]|nr:hypothetical protein [Pseudomonadales bacterium]
MRDDLADAGFSAAQRGEQVRHIGETQSARQRRQRRCRQSHAAQLALEQRAPRRGEPLPILLPEPMADPASRARRVHEGVARTQPVAVRRRVLASQYLDAFAGGEHVVQPDDAAVHTRATAAVPQLAVDLVSEVDRRRSRRQIDHVTVRGQHVDTIGDHLAPQVFGNRLAGVELAAPLDDLAQPRDLVVVAASGRRAIAALVGPVRTDPQLGFLMHVAGADLHLEHLAAVTDHRGVQRAVAVVLGVRDVVVEFAGQVAPESVHHAERRVAVGDRAHQRAHRTHVVHLAYPDPLALHLAPDAVQVLRPARELRTQARRRQRLGEARDRRRDEVVAIGAPFREQLRDTAVIVGLQLAEREVLELPLDLPHPEPVRERCVDLHRCARGLLRLLAAIRRIQIAQCLHALGEPHQRHTRVVDHRYQHAPQHLALATPVRETVGASVPRAGPQHVHAPHTLEQGGYAFAEALAYHRVIDRVRDARLAEHAGDQRIGIEPKHRQRLDDIECRRYPSARSGHRCAGMGAQ